MFNIGDAVKVVNSRNNLELLGKIGTIVDIKSTFTVDFHKEIYDKQGKLCTHDGTIYKTLTHWHFFRIEDLELVHKNKIINKPFNLRNM